MENNFLQDFWDTYDEKSKSELGKKKYAEQAIKRKEQLLIPVRVLLKKFVDAGLMVENAEKFSSYAHHLDPQPFQVYEGPSSPTWAPGTSLYFDHPATVEIAVPNEEKNGIISIRVASHHPDANILHKKLMTIEDVCQALSKFLAKNTLSLKNPDKLR